MESAEEIAVRKDFTLLPCHSVVVAPESAVSHLKPKLS
jgi:hypothetical protein